MKRRTFLQTLGGLVAGAFVSNVAAIYSPGRPWEVPASENLFRYSKTVTVPAEWLEDPTFDLPALIAERLGERLSERENKIADDCFRSRRRIALKSTPPPSRQPASSPQPPSGTASIGTSA